MNHPIILAWLLSTIVVVCGYGGDGSCRGHSFACLGSFLPVTSHGANNTTHHSLSRYKLQTTRQRETAIMSFLTSFLLQHTSKRDVFIIHDFTLPGLVGMVESCFQSLVDTTLFSYDLARLELATSPQNQTSNVRFLLVLCSYNNTMEIFDEVRNRSLESRHVRWLVMAEGREMLYSLPNFLREGTHVGLVLRVATDRYHIFTSYVDINNRVSFREVGTWRVEETGQGSLTQPLFPDLAQTYTQPLFPDLAQTYRDFEGRELTVAAVHNFPFFTLHTREDLPPLPDRGIDVNIVRALGEFLNFTFRVTVPLDGRWGGPQSDGTVTGMIGEVAWQRAHLAIDEITITDLRETVVDFTQPYFIESTTLVSRTPAERSRSLAVFSPFSFYLWLLLVVVTLLMGPLVYLVSQGHDLCLQPIASKVQYISQTKQDPLANLVPFAKHDLTPTSKSLPDRRNHHNIQSSSLSKLKIRNLSQENRDSLQNTAVVCFNVFRSLVSQGNLLPARSWPIRIVFFSWYTFCIILYALYAGTLTAYMTKPSYKLPIDSLEDLVEAQVHGYVPAVQAGTSTQRILKNAKSGIFKALWEITDPSRSFPRSGKEAMEMVLTKKIVYMSTNLNSEFRATQKGRHLFHLAINTFLPQGYGVACRPGAPFLGVFDTLLGRMLQSGLVIKWVEDEVTELRTRSGQVEQREGGGGGQAKRVESRALSLDDVQGAFYILCSGYLLAVVVFLLESRKPKIVLK